MDWVDVVVVLLALAAAASGWRQGFLVSALAFLGLVGGAVLGIKVAPFVVEQFVGPITRLAVGVVVVLVVTGIGESLGVYLGRHARVRVRWRPARTADATGGAVLHAIGALLAAWLIAVPLAGSSNTALATGVRDSRILALVDAAIPDSVRELAAELRALLKESGFPDVVSPFTTTPPATVAPPDPGALSEATVRRAEESVFKIHGIAPSCQRGIEGTGFVIARDRMMTNAHVVAGTDQLTVDTPTGAHTARVVYDDPNTDVAVLDVPGLTARPLTFDNTASTGENTVALGYPLDGPLTSSPARVSQRINLRGPNIYNSATVTRDVYTIRGLIRPGNSGGPLIDAQGHVVGVVFAAATDQADTGFVLTTNQVRAAAAAAGNTTPVDTGPCTD